MQLTSLVTFELTEKVAKKFLECESFPMPSHFPFEEFAVSIPMSSFIESESLNRIVTEKIRKKPLWLQNKIESFLGSNITVFLTVGNDDTIIISIHDDEVTAVEAHFQNGEFKIIKSIGTQEQSLAMIVQCLHISQGVVWHYMSPITVKKVSQLRERKSESIIKGYNSPSKKYIYRTRYVFENACRDISKEKREFNRKTDTWMVSGHTRKYRDADGNVIKEVYIKPYKKGTGAINNLEYRITRA